MDDEEGNKKLVSILKQDMAAIMENELKVLKTKIESLEKTMANMKNLVRLQINDYKQYTDWSKFIDEISVKFKQKYSFECNELFNLHLRNENKYGNMWNNIVFNAKKFDEKFTNETKSIQKRKTQEKSDERAAKKHKSFEIEFHSNPNFEGYDEGDLLKLFDGDGKDNEEEVVDGKEEKEKTKKNEVEIVDEIGEVEVENFKEFMEKYL